MRTRDPAVLGCLSLVMHSYDSGRKSIFWSPPHKPGPSGHPFFFPQASVLSAEEVGGQANRYCNHEDFRHHCTVVTITALQYVRLWPTADCRILYIGARGLLDPRCGERDELCLTSCRSTAISAPNVMHSTRGMWRRPYPIGLFLTPTCFQPLATARSLVWGLRIQAAVVGGQNFSSVNIP